MKKSRSISACRIAIFLVISLIINRPIIYVACFIYLLFFGYKNSLIYILLVIISITNLSIKYDFLPLGIVEKKNNNYYVIDKVIYKTITYNEVEIGDVVYTIKSEEITDDNYLKKNIRFNDKKIDVLCNFRLRNQIFREINSNNNVVLDGLNKFIYNINSYDDLSYNFGYGLAIYYLLKIIERKNKYIAFILMFVYSLLFYFDIKFYLIIVDIILNKNNNKYWYKLILLCILNDKLLLNYSILIPILLQFYRKWDFKIKFKSYLSIIESICFGSINLISIILYKYYIVAQILLFLMSILCILIPNLNGIYERLLSIYSLINSINFDIRGTISISLLFFYIYFIRAYNTKNEVLQLIILISILISPINNPFMHVSFIDVGQGDSILIKLPLNCGNILIDTGSKYNYYKLRKFLYKEGIYRIDYLIITHNDSDHNGNVNSIKNDFDVREVVTSGKDIEIGNLKLKNLYIDEFDNDNDSSLVYWMKVNDISFLFTGDISNSAERLLVNKYKNIDVDILKVSHHGSDTATSDYFIGKILPHIGIISTSGQYGHPKAETLNTLDSYLVDYYTTKEKGNISIYMTKLVNILKSDKFDFVIIK